MKTEFEPVKGLESYEHLSLCSIEPSRDLNRARLAVKNASITGLALLSAASLLTGCGGFTDMPGPSKNDFGRTVNSISAVIAGIVAQNIYTNSSFKFTIEKPLFADAIVLCRDCKY